MRFAVECENTPEECDHCGKSICQRCGRCYTKYVGPVPPIRYKCPSYTCRLIKWFRYRVVP